MDVKKELFARIKLPELNIEARVTILANGEVEVSFTPWNQWSLTGESFEQLVEDYNLLKSHIKLCLDNQAQERLVPPPRPKD